MVLVVVLEIMGGPGTSLKITGVRGNSPEDN